MSENIKIMDTIHEMEAILEDASGFPLSKKVGIDKDEFLDLLADLKEALPFELETAINIIKEQDAILEAARNDAKFLLDDAKRERDQKYKECNDEILIKNKQVDSEIENMMKEATIRAEELVSDHKITKDSRARSDKMIKEATEYTRDLRESARAYSIELLTTAENTLADLLAELRDNKSQL